MVYDEDHEVVWVGTMFNSPDKILQSIFILKRSSSSINPI